MSFQLIEPGMIVYDHLWSFIVIITISKKAVYIAIPCHKLISPQLLFFITKRMHRAELKIHWSPLLDFCTATNGLTWNIFTCICGTCDRVLPLGYSSCNSYMLSLIFKPGACRPVASAHLVSWNCFYADVCMCVLIIFNFRNWEG